MLDKFDTDFIIHENASIKNKLDLTNEHLSMIQKTLYQLTLEQVKTNAFLELLIESKFNSNKS